MLRAAGPEQVEKMRDPDSEISELTPGPVVATRPTKVRYYTSREANRIGALTERQRERLVCDSPECEHNTSMSSVVESVRAGLKCSGVCHDTAHINACTGLRLTDEPVRNQPGASAQPAASRGSTDPGRREVELVCMAASHCDATSQASAPSGSILTDVLRSDTSSDTNTETVPSPASDDSADAHRTAPGPASAPTLADIPSPSPASAATHDLARTADAGEIRSRLLDSIGGTQYLRRGSVLGDDYRRWTATVGLLLGNDGALTAQIIRDIASTPRAAHTLLRGDAIGHIWHIDIERIQSATEQAEAQQIADDQVYRILEFTGEQTDKLRDEAIVHDRASMEHVLSTLMHMLSGGTQGSICGPADLRILQDFPPLAMPEGGGGG